MLHIVFLAWTSKQLAGPRDVAEHVLIKMFQQHNLTYQCNSIGFAGYSWVVCLHLVYSSSITILVTDMEGKGKEPGLQDQHPGFHTDTVLAISPSVPPCLQLKLSNYQLFQSVKLASKDTITVFSLYQARCVIYVGIKIWTRANNLLIDSWICTFHFFSTSGAYSKYYPINLKSILPSLITICPTEHDLA